MPECRVHRAGAFVISYPRVIRVIVIRVTVIRVIVIGVIVGHFVRDHGEGQESWPR